MGDFAIGVCLFSLTFGLVSKKNTLHRNSVKLGKHFGNKSSGLASDF